MTTNKCPHTTVTCVATKVINVKGKLIIDMDWPTVEAYCVQCGAEILPEDVALYDQKHINIGIPKGVVDSTDPDRKAKGGSK